MNMRVCDFITEAKLKLPKGTRGEDVRQVQHALIQLGFRLPKWGADGKIGPETEKAIKAFQQFAFLNPTGKLDQETIDQLQWRIGDWKPISISKRTTPNTPTVKQEPSAFGDVRKIAKLKDRSTETGTLGFILDFIARYESTNGSGSYASVFPNRLNPKLLKMTIRQAYKYSHSQADKYGSSAIGRYQFISKYLLKQAKRAGLDINKDLFSPENQDKIAYQYLKDASYPAWIKGDIDDGQFLNRLANIWRSLPTMSGDNVKDKSGLNPQALTTTDNALANIGYAKLAGLPRSFTI